MGIVFDYSYARPLPEKMKLVGGEGVIRYVAGGTGSGKEIELWELRLLREAGLAVGLVWETSAARALDGANAGVADALAADQQADQLGYPLECTVYYACDTDARRNFAGAVDYFRGVRSVSRRPVGCYAGKVLFEPLLDGGTIQYAWQAAALSWSDYEISPRAALVQRVGQPWDLGGAYDFNDVQTPWGGWGVVAPTPRWLHYTTPRMKGEDVREVQRQLLDLGYYLGPWGADGDFGQATDAAVRQFQQDQVNTGVPGWDQSSVDGIVGPQTRRRLAELLSP